MNPDERHFLNLLDWTRAEIESVFSIAQEFKQAHYKAVASHDFTPPYADTFRNLSALGLFMHPSTRTVSSFSVAWESMGGHFRYENMSNTHHVNGEESLRHLARVYSRFYQCLFVRISGPRSHDQLLDFAAHSQVPVINAMNGQFHPLQGLTDLFTIRETFGETAGLQITYFGNGNNNVTHSLMLAASLCGMRIAIICPEDLQNLPFTPVRDVRTRCLENFRMNGGDLLVSHDAGDPVIADTDILVTDSHTKMGYPDRDNDRFLEALRAYRIDKDVIRKIKKDRWYFMHCMPVHGNEVVLDVAEDPARSIIFRQAENRLHIQRALLFYLATRNPDLNPFRAI